MDKDDVELLPVAAAGLFGVLAVAGTEQRQRLIQVLETFIVPK